jgi:uncharacterized damage-inducible protein DinB
MSESSRIADQALKMFEGGAWHGPSVMELLADVGPEVAASYPIAGAHSIWELVLHLIATQDAILKRMEGIPAGLKTEDFWLPVPPVSDIAWRETVDCLKRQEKELRAAIDRFPDARLQEVLVPGGSFAYTMFHGHVQHNAYHAGQIALLKKAVGKHW